MQTHTPCTDTREKVVSDHDVTFYHSSSDVSSPPVSLLLLLPHLLSSAEGEALVHVALPHDYAGSSRPLFLALSLQRRCEL